MPRAKRSPISSAKNAAAEAENKKLKEDRAYLQTAQGKEAEARKLGFVKEGEISLIVEHPEKSEPPVLNPPPPPVKKTFWQKVADKAATVFATRNKSGHCHLFSDQSLTL